MDSEELERIRDGVAKLLEVDTDPVHGTLIDGMVSSFTLIEALVGLADHMTDQLVALRKRVKALEERSEAPAGQPADRDNEKPVPIHGSVTPSSPPVAPEGQS